MQFTKFLIAAAAFTVASAQTAKFTNTNFSGIQVGSPFNITWAGASSDITIKLKTGPANAQTLVGTIAGPGFTGTSFLWTPAATIVDGTYNLEIDHATDPPNYSIPFTITGGLASSSVASSATSSAASSVASASSTVTVTTTGTASTSTAASLGNSTTSSAGKPSSATSASRPSGTSSSASVPTSNNAAQYASPFAFVLMSFVAIAALN